jgi:diguanylate cyclase (GGDEF)-like protein
VTCDRIRKAPLECSQQPELVAMRNVCQKALRSSPIAADTAEVEQVSRRGRRTSFAWGAFAAYLVTVLAIGALVPVSVDMSSMVLLLLEVGAVIGGTIIGTKRARRSVGIERKAWTAMASYNAIAAAILFISAGYQGVTGTPIPVPSPVELLWLASYICGALFTALLGFGGQHLLLRWRTALDGVLISVSLFFVSWAFVLGPLCRERGVDEVSDFVFLAYPIADVILLTFVTLALRQRGAANRRIVSLTAAGVTTLAVTDSTVIVTTGAETAPPIAIAFYCVAISLIAVAGLVKEPAVAKVPENYRRSRLQLLTPYFPVSLALFVGTAFAIGKQDFDPVLIGVGVTILALAMVRQMVALLDHYTMAERLADVVFQLELSQSELQYQAHNDQLTSLFNRRYLEEYVDSHDTTRAGRIATLFLDLNDFKIANDTYGHEIGDALLIETAERLRRCVRPSDVVVRLGGDEFAVLLEDVSDVVDVETVAQRVFNSIRNDAYVVNGQEVDLSASVGYAMQADREPFSDLLRRSDMAMYAAKRRGGGFLPFTQAMEN